MKQWLSWTVLALTLSIPASALAEVQYQYVQVDKTRLLAKPSAFSKAKTVLLYRAKVEVLGRKGAYIRVRVESGEGYVPERSLGLKKPVYSAKLSKQYVSSDEVAMATKGFNAQVESEYRRTNPTLDYDNLNQLEKVTACPDPAAAHAAFRKSGKLGEFCEGGDAE